MLALSLIAAAAVPLSIIPAPLSVTTGDGVFRLDAATVIAAPRVARGVARLLHEELSPSTGLPLRVVGERPTAPAIRLVLTGADAETGEEGYRLSVRAAGVEIRAATPAGLFYGCQSLRQLLPPAGLAPALRHAEWTVPCCEIVDRPRFRWRGLHLDVSRHFFDVAFVEKLIDALALHKMNVFHWHLTDDGGWRLEITRYPRLTRVGAWRADQGVEWSYTGLDFPGRRSGRPVYGGYYSQREVREVVRYAAERFVTVVPEIEMPGHSTETVAAYPELACAVPAETRAAYLAEEKALHPSMVCAGKQATETFFENVLAEVLELFPSAFIHVGGDEVDKTLWAACPDCRARMAEAGLKDVEELQSDFMRRIERFLAARGRRLVGWDEILEGGLPPGATVMSWRGVAGGVAAAKTGHDVVMSPTSHCYFDYAHATTPTRAVHGWEPVPAELSAGEARHVLGGQANVWTEWLSSEEEVETMVFPRAAALAEVLWSAAGRNDWPGFVSRLQAHALRLDALGIASFLEPPAAVSPLVVLGSGASLDFESLPVADAVIRFTRDGSEPTAASPEWRGPIAPAAPLQIRAAAFRGASRSAVTDVAAIVLEAPTIGNLVPGLARRAVHGSYTTCPTTEAFTDATPTRVPAVGLGELAGTEQFALLFDGFLRLAEAGEYTFWLGSDDGSRLWLGGGLAIDHDGLHGYSEKSVTVALPAGDVPIRVEMFEQGGGDALTLEVQGPGLERRPVGGGLVWSR
jgi:hexosaminidase